MKLNLDSNASTALMSALENYLNGKWYGCV